ncbi:MAG: HAD-IIIA family hydrolase [Deltaproteobacteria bacterium]|nr:HAD-IIIA family hydrolase [Deltaproteobacteria bacterium]
MGKCKVKNRAVFLDRDGVINHVVIRDGKAFAPRSREEFIIVEDTAGVIKDLKDRGFLVIVVTNQPEIARGSLAQDDLDWMTKKIMRETAVDEVIVCPHDDGDGCDCRKPLPGMILAGARKWEIDLENSYMIGDGWKDMKAGNSAGCKCILIDAVYNQDVVCDVRVDKLYEAVELIINS